MATIFSNLNLLIILITFAFVAHISGFKLYANITNYCEEIIEERLALPGSKSTFWPGGIVPYVTSSNLREQDHLALTRAIEEYDRYTCIRFVPKTDNDKIFLQIEMSDDPSFSACGGAPVCYNPEKPSFMKINMKCSDVPTFTHEMGHVLCLRHEHVRPDREQFLDISVCPNGSRQGVQDYDVTNSHIYDYLSQMHYDCVGNQCYTGIPKLPGVNTCGGGSGLSTIDADRLNYHYNCKGCLRHRWYRVDTLTKEEESTLVNFSTGLDGDTEPLHVCRGYFDGVIVLGKYHPDRKACLLGIYTYNSPIWVSEHIQLFGLPEGPYTVSSGGPGYALLDPKDTTFQNNYVPMGRLGGSSRYYLAVTQLEGKDGKKQTILGTTDDRFYKLRAYFPTEGKTEEILLEQKSYLLFGCTQ